MTTPVLNMLKIILCNLTSIPRITRFSTINNKVKFLWMFEATFGLGLGWIIFTGGGGTNASNISASASVNTREDGIHLVLCSV